MELIKEKTYYHIQRYPSWKKGQVYFFGLEKNHYCNFFDIYGHNFEDPITKKIFHPNIAAEYLIEYFETGRKDEESLDIFSYDIPFTIRALRDVIWNYSRYLRELLFEEVRLDFFPNYPSRQKGIWVISNKRDIPYWIKTIGAGKESAVFEVLLTGKIHEANHESIKLTTNSFNGIRRQAFKYWMTEKIFDSNIGNECIFEGTVIVKDVIPISIFL